MTLLNVSRIQESRPLRARRRFQSNTELFSCNPSSHQVVTRIRKRL